MISTDGFRKSSFSGGEGCVEVRLLPDGNIALRDGNDVSLPPHHLTATKGNAFLGEVDR